MAWLSPSSLTGNAGSIQFKGDSHDGHGVSLLPVLSLEGGRRDRDALAADVVEHVDFIGQCSAGEYLEYIEGLLQGTPRRPPRHHPLHLVPLESHRGASRALSRPCRHWTRPPRPCTTRRRALVSLRTRT